MSYEEYKYDLHTLHNKYDLKVIAYKIMSHWQKGNFVEFNLLFNCLYLHQLCNVDLCNFDLCNVQVKVRVLP